MVTNHGGLAATHCSDRRRHLRRQLHLGYQHQMRVQHDAGGSVCHRRGSCACADTSSGPGWSGHLRIGHELQQHERRLTGSPALLVAPGDQSVGTDLDSRVGDGHTGHLDEHPPPTPRCGRLPWRADGKDDRVDLIGQVGQCEGAARRYAHLKGSVGPPLVHLGQLYSRRVRVPVQVGDTEASGSLYGQGKAGVRLVERRQTDDRVT